VINDAGLRHDCLFALSIIRGELQIGEPRLRGVSVSTEGELPRAELTSYLCEFSEIM
jgi:hypothetical protein